MVDEDLKQIPPKNILILQKQDHLQKKTLFIWL